MKTLDEVIKAFECCEHGEPDSNCKECPYISIGACCLERENDALHYLKELRDMTDIPMEYFENGGTSQKVRNTSQITCPKCHSEFAILDDPDGDHQQLLKCQALLQDFYRNEPLTWSELKQMEGKPVWVDEYDEIDSTKGWHRCRWYLVHYVNGDYCYVYDSDGEENYFDLSEYGKSWTAFRKERR